MESGLHAVREERERRTAAARKRMRGHRNGPGAPRLRAAGLPLLKSKALNVEPSLLQRLWMKGGTKKKKTNAWQYFVTVIDILFSSYNK